MASSIRVSLSELDKWKAFYPKTEMIVTKRRGRVIFPHLNYILEGLEPKSLYTVHIHLERVDEIKYKFDAAEWKEAGKGEPILKIQCMEHPDGARSGEHWMAEPVSFSHLKITNDPKNGDPKLVLVQSMHKYQPVVTIRKVGDSREEQFRLIVTQFIVVTAYQSEEMIALKVAHNKFASGFRSNGKKRQSSEDCENSVASKRSSTDSSPSSNSTTPPIMATNWQNQMMFPNFIPPVPPVQQTPQFTAGQQPNPFMDATNFYWNQYYGGAWQQYQMGMWGNPLDPSFQNI